MLVENYLWAVVSLPAGVFNPSSGVKTSLLYLDKNLAKRTDNILFVKVTNDGFDLGAQRRLIEGSELPEALKIMDSHKRAQKAQEGKMALTVSRERLLESPDCNLSGERYRAVAVHGNGQWPMVKLRDVCQINPPKSELKDEDQMLEVSFAPMSALRENRPSFAPTETRAIQDVINGYTYFRDNNVLLAKITPCFENGKVGIAGGLLHGIGFGSTEFIVLRPDEKSILSHLLYYFVASQGFRNHGIAHMTGSVGQQRLPVSFVESYEIPLPPLEEQERIVAELDGYRKVIEGARQVVENYKPTIRVAPEWPRKSLAELASLEYGLTARGEDAGDTRLIRITDITDEGYLRLSGAKFIDLNGEARRYLLKENDVLVARTGATYGKTLLFVTGVQSVFASYLIRLRFNDDIVPQYYWTFAQSEMYWAQARSLVTGGGQPQFNGNALKKVTVPIPPLDVQRKIISEIESEGKLVESNRKLIAAFEKKIQTKLAEIWGAE